MSTLALADAHRSALIEVAEGHVTYEPGTGDYLLDGDQVVPGSLRAALVGLAGAHLIRCGPSDGGSANPVVLTDAGRQVAQ